MNNLPLILLHGALGSTTQLEALRAQAPDNQEIYAINLPGHGGIAAPDSFSMGIFSDAVLAFLEENKLSQVNFFGYSMGGYVALWFAWKYPDKTALVKTYGTKLDWNPDTAAGMTRMFDPEKIAAKAPQLAENLALIHGAEQWKTLCRQTSAFLTDLGNGQGIPGEAFTQIQCPVSIGWGDQDNVVTEAESRRIAEIIPKATLVVLPEGRHLIEQVDPAQLARFVFA